MNTETVQKFRLENIHMLRSSSERGSGSLEGQVRLETEAHMRNESQPDKLYYVVGLNYSALDKADEPQIKGSVEFVLVYSLAPDFTPTPEDIEEYAYRGVAFQAHPYLREHVAAVCTRSGLPAYTLPVLVAGTSIRIEDEPGQD